MVFGAGILALGTVKTTTKIAEGQDPSLTEAFLLAAGLPSSFLALHPAAHGMPPAGMPVAREPVLEPALDAQNQANIPEPDALVFPVEPLKPLLDWNPLFPLFPLIPLKPILDWVINPQMVLSFAPVAPISVKPLLDWDIADGPHVSDVAAPLADKAIPESMLARDETVIQPLQLTYDDPIIHEITARLTPSPANQLAAGEHVVVLGSKLTGIRQYVENGRLITSLRVEQHIADASDLRLENIMALISARNRGEDISVSDVFVAVVKDLFENPGEILQHLVHPGQVYEALRGRRTVNVDIVSTSVRREDSQALGGVTEGVEFKRQSPDADVTIQAERSLNTHQTVARTLNVHEMHYQWGEATFTDHVPSASEADLAAGSTTETRVEETIRTTTDHGMQARGQARINDDAAYTAATEETHHQTVDTERRVYSTNQDVSSAAADARLTDDEVRAAKMHLEQETGEREAEFSYQTPGDAHAPRAEGNDPAQLAATREAMNVLRGMLENMAAGEPLTLETGQQVSDAVLETRRGAGPMPVNPHSGMHTTYQEAGPEHSSTSDSERHEEVDWGMDKKIRTETTDSVQSTYGSEIHADQLTMDTRFRSTGMYDRPGALPAHRRESRSIITVDEVHGERRTSQERTIHSKTAFEIDTGKVLGRDIKSSTAESAVTETPTRKIYAVRNADIRAALADGRLSAEEVEALDAELLHMEQGAARTTHVADPGTGGHAFESGWIDYAPLGSFVSAGMKSSYGHELSASDMFWVAVDGVLTITTVGAGATLIKGGGKAAARGIAKNVVQGNVKKAGQQIVKAGKELATNTGKRLADDIKAPFTTVKDALEYTVKHNPVETIQEAGRQVVGRAKMVINTRTGNRFDLDKLAPPSDPRHGIRLDARKHINHQYAGKTFPASKFNDPKVEKLFPDGVRFTADAFPDFKPYATKNVKINNLTGNHAADFAKANKAAGYNKTPGGFTWHHHQNGKDMLLVPTDLHHTVRHSGGASLLKEQSAIIGKMIRHTATGVNIGSKIAVKPGSGE